MFTQQAAPANAALPPSALGCPPARRGPLLLLGLEHSRAGRQLAGTGMWCQLLKQR